MGNRKAVVIEADSPDGARAGWAPRPHDLMKSGLLFGK